MNWRPKEGWENGWDTEREYDGMASKAEIFEAGADAMHQADVKWLEDYVFYVDTRGYIALKTNATKNWQTFKGKEETE